VLWVCVNERDELGDELVPDYMTGVKQGGFYGWPYAYFGYFPTYALGSAYAAQFYHKMKEEIDVDQLLLDSQYPVIMEWLKTHVHQYANRYSPDEVLEKMRAMFPDAKIVLTLGKDGAKYAEGDKVYHQPIFNVKAVDTTAAGDTFTGYFLAGMIDNMDIEDILKMSSKASSIAVTRHGAVQSIPLREEVEEALKS
jgi:hypothetical protein